MADVRQQLEKTLSGSYTIDRELGGGGMSRVFVARDTTLERLVVVKVLSPELAAGLSAERFTRETKLAASLQQANIVPVLAAGATVEGLPYYTMPFVEGESLRSRMAKQGAPSISEVIGIVRDVAKALAYAHERGVVHRDIKPDNVLLSGGTAVVTDFGIAKALSAARTDAGGGATLTQLGTSIGTPAYMAPEQAAGDPDIDFRADIYSLGAMAYELISGRAPFHGRTPQRMLAAHMSEIPQPVGELRPDAPAALAELVMKCLAKDASARPQSATDVVRALDSVTSGGGLPAMPSILIGGSGMLRKALGLYAAAFVVVAIVARAAIVAIGLPDWVFPGALIVMALGLPVILFTAYVHRVNRRLATTTPTFTPGGTPSMEHGTMATLALKATPHVSWRRATMGGLYALGAFTFAVGGFMALRALGIGPAGSLFAAGKLQKRDPILLTDFRITNADSALGRVVSDAVRQGFSESSAITLVSPTTIAAALRRMQQPSTKSLDLALARELAQRENVKAIIDGDVAGVGTSYLLTLRLVTADSGNQLASVSATGEGPKGLIDAADKASRALRAKIGESLRKVQARAALSRETTGSLEALRKYSEAFRANSFEQNYLESARLAREAVAIDSNFAMAWRILGVSMANAGQPRAGTDSALERAYLLRDRLSDRERAWTAANYYTQGPGRDRVKAYAAWEAVVAAGDTGFATLYLGNALRDRREFDRADSVYRLAIRSTPDQTFPYLNRVGVLVTAGRLAAADTAIRTARDRLPTVRRAAEMQLELKYHHGDVDGLNRSADSLERSSNLASRSWALSRKSELALRAGRRRESVQLFQRAWVVDSARGLLPTELLDSAEAAIEESIVRDSNARAARMMDAALVRHPIRALAQVDRPYLQVATAYARAGRSDRARAVLASYTAEVTDTGLRRFQLPAYRTALGEVALAEGKFGEALTQFRRGDSLPDGPVNSCTICLPLRLARTFDAANRVDSAIVMYESYLDSPYYFRFNRVFDGTNLAGVHKRLGELYEGRGDRQRALSHYLAFVDLWKNADSELQPKVADVRHRIARLRDTEKR